MSIDATAAPGGAAGHNTTDDRSQPDWSVFTRYAVIAVFVGFGLWLGAGLGNLASASEAEKGMATKRFALSYLSGYIFWLSLPIGAMNLLMIAYLTKTSWGLLLRRPFEAAIRTSVLFFLLFIPVMVVVGIGKDASPYWWTSPEEAIVPKPEPITDKDHAENKRERAVNQGIELIRKTVEREREARNKGIYDFLSVPSFIFCSLVLWGIWFVMIYLLTKWGRDASDETSTVRVDGALERLKNFSGLGIIIYALTITAASTLWVMSLEPSWSSTMFPVIFAVNQFLTCFAFCLAVFLFIVGRPPFINLMRPKFQLDMGTLMLAFTLFWSYTSFSQFMLVWIGNLPEEIPFYLKRSWTGASRSGWWYVSAALIVLHFALPFLLLLFRDIKLHPARLRTVAMYLCVICAMDVIWWIAPSQPSSSGFPYVLMDIGSVIGVGGLFVLAWVWNLKQRPLFPMSQAFLLPEGHHHGNH